MKTLLKLFFIFLLLLVIPAAQVNVKTASGCNIPPTDGKLLYAKYCAGCHGDALTGKQMLKETVAPNTDLTHISNSHDRSLVYKVRSRISSGTSSDLSLVMPAWGKVLVSEYNGDEGKASVAIQTLAQHVVSQQKVSSD